MLKGTLMPISRQRWWDLPLMVPVLDGRLALSNWQALYSASSMAPGTIISWPE
jgi:hypothetical protein